MRRLTTSQGKVGRMDAMPVSRAPFFTLVSLIGQSQLRKMVRDGLPLSLRSPFQFLLNGKAEPEDCQVAARIEHLRFELAKRENDFVTTFSDTGPRPTPRQWFSPENSPQIRSRVRSLPQVAYVSSVLPRWGIFLYLCGNATRAKTILELGSSAGISGCYLASGKYCQRFVTVEGSPELSILAETHLRQIANNFEVVNAPFNAALEKILPSLRDGLDMIYMDGEKDKRAALHCFERLTPYLNNRCVVVFDDIHWSSQMREVWQELCRWKGLSFAINAGRFGVCLWSGGTARPKVYDLFMVAGVDLYEIKQRFEDLRTWWSRG